jgi:nucleoside-diphosphate-sugar epimerase
MSTQTMTRPDNPTPIEDPPYIVRSDDRILITGAAGFIGSRVVEILLNYGFRNLTCFVRPSSNLARMESSLKSAPADARIELVRGNLLSREDCERACSRAAVILHLASGTGEKSFPDAFMNSVVTTRNLLDASLRSASLRRFVLVSSFTVYTNRRNLLLRVLDESCPIEERPHLRGDAYCFAKVKQEQLVADYGKTFGIPYVVVRPGSVYGPGHNGMTGRIGLGTFGLFLHLGGANTIPFTYVENCAKAIALAGLVQGVDGEAFNIVDDDLPTSRHFLRQYKRSVRSFGSVYVPHAVSYALSFLWEKYSHWSKGQLPPAFNRARWHVEWKRTRYSNMKLKTKLGWSQKVSTAEGMRLYFQSLEASRHDA